MLPRHRAPSHRRDRHHLGGQFRPGLVGGDARHRGKLLSRCVDEPLDHVRVGPGAGAAGSEDLGVHGRRRFLHESGHADGRAADEPAEPHALSGLQPRLWRDLECRPAECRRQRLRGDRARVGSRTCVRVSRSSNALEREFAGAESRERAGPHLRGARSRAVLGRRAETRAAAVRRPRAEIPLRPPRRERHRLRYFRYQICGFPGSHTKARHPGSTERRVWNDPGSCTTSAAPHPGNMLQKYISSTIL